MNFDKQIIIDNVEYHLEDIQRSGNSAIYKDNINYLRIGAPEKIDKDLSFHKKMEAFGFPIAKLRGEGDYQGMRYFIEKSLGDEHFGQILKRETQALGHVSDESFEIFLNILIKFGAAQIKTISSDQDWESFRNGIHLDIICRELPEYADRIVARYKQSEERLKAFPFGIMHGDFTPFNIYPKGVIDLEDSFVGPLGYDLGSFVEIQNWFPETSDDEFHRVYKFTPEQRAKLISSIDDLYVNAGLAKISDYTEDFNLTKGIWFTVRMQSLPKLQQFRYELIKQLI